LVPLLRPWNVTLKGSYPPGQGRAEPHAFMMEVLTATVAVVVGHRHGHCPAR